MQVISNHSSARSHNPPFIADYQAHTVFGITQKSVRHNFPIIRPSV